MASATLVDAPAPPASGLRGRAFTLPMLAAVLGAAGFLVTFAWSWIPSFWGDEAASVMSAERPLPSLFAMLGRVDAVHGTYYLFLHVWIDFFGASELSVRAPSAIAVGIAVAGTVTLAGILATRRIALYAGVVCIVLPRMNYLGGEARSYALATAVAVWLTVVLALIVTGRIRGRRAWAGYAVLLAVGTYLFLYLALILVAHAVFVVPGARDGRTRQRRMLRNWMLASGAAAATALPIAVLGYLERGQIKFLATRAVVTVPRIFVEQWFGNPVLAIASWLLIVTAIVAAVVVWRRTGERPTFVALSAAWLAAPTVLLLLATVTVMPSYTIRYLSFSTPAAALLVAVGIDAALTRRGLRVVALAVVIAAAVPSLVAQRLPFAKDGGSDWREASSYLGADAHPGDAVVFDDSARPSRRPRSAIHLYPNDYAGLDDVLLSRSFDQTTWLWDRVLPVTDATVRLDAVSTVWVLEYRGSPDDVSGSTRSELEAQGFAQQRVTDIHRTVIYEMTRSEGND